jgi:hypothetical protein
MSQIVSMLHKRGMSLPKSYRVYVLHNRSHVSCAVEVRPIDKVVASYWPTGGSVPVKAVYQMSLFWKTIGEPRKYQCASSNRVLRTETGSGEKTLHRRKQKYKQFPHLRNYVPGATKISHKYNVVIWGYVWETEKLRNKLEIDINCPLSAMINKV